MALPSLHNGCLDYELYTSTKRLLQSVISINVTFTISSISSHYCTRTNTTKLYMAAVTIDDSGCKNLMTAMTDLKNKSRFILSCEVIT